MSLHALVHPQRVVELDGGEEMKTFGGSEKSAQNLVLPVADFEVLDDHWDDAELEEDSPYPEVRSAVSNTGA